MELGTGWQPIIPIVFFLAGSEQISLVDKQKLLDAKGFFSTVNCLIPYVNKLSERLKIPPNDVENWLSADADKPLAYYLSRFNMEYIAPCDILNANIPHKSIDIVISRAVLEHINPKLLRRLFILFRLLLRDNGKMFHIIDNSDHWQHGDNRLSRLNFLKFNERVFSLISSFNPLDYQNRLRHFEYIEMLKSSGFRIDFSDSQVDTKALEDLNILKISEKYQDIPKEELAILTSYIVATKI